MQFEHNNSKSYNTKQVKKHSQVSFFFFKFEVHLCVSGCCWVFFVVCIQTSTWRSETNTGHTVKSCDAQYLKPVLSEQTDLQLIIYS